LLIPFFPWQLTPLTARSLSAWLLAVGTLLLSMSFQKSRTQTRLATPMLIFLLPVLGLQMLRYAEQVTWLNPALWLSLMLFAVIGLFGLVLAFGSWREALR